MNNPIISKKLDYDDCSHGFFTRKGGFSNGIYNSLNCSVLSDDITENVLKNRNYICLRIGTGSNNLIFPHQKHTNKCIIVSKSLNKKYKADAIVTKERNIALCVLTADCMPILLYEREKKIIGAIHAGWKGAKNGIIENTIKEIVSLGGSSNKIIAAIGPCIQKESYQVGDEFRSSFINDDPDNIDLFHKKDRSYFFDLSGYSVNCLKKSGIEEIDRIKRCTFSEEDYFFSYRRSTKKKEKDYGRQVSTIMLKNL
tara:strand:- start:5836 stop:6600 length:765 start_codon:yes stop_codon:yes gene_type:complete